jgi:hypothetical protein
MSQVESVKQSGAPAQYVDAVALLEILFPDTRCRPSMRWLRTRVAERTLPFVRIGRLCFFDPQMVKSYLDARAMKKVRVA